MPDVPRAPLMPQHPPGAGLAIRTGSVLTILLVTVLTNSHRRRWFTRGPFMKESNDDRKPMAPGDTGRSRGRIPQQRDSALRQCARLCVHQRNG